MNIKQAIERFPSVELSYDKLLHKKVRARMFSLLPQGSRCLLWFTTVGSDNVPILLTLDKRGNIESANVKTMSFGDDLCIGDGSIFAGILFKHGNSDMFTFLDPVIYKSQPVWKEKCDTKLSILQHTFTHELCPPAYGTGWLVPGLPYMTDSFGDAIEVARTLPYSLHGIRLTEGRKTRHLGYVKYTGRQISVAVMKVKAQLLDDVYGLYCSDHKRGTIPRIAFVQDYSSSVMMNKLFRCIKENDNLDLLEESDDEEEFENVSGDKFVDTKKIVHMECVYEPRFRKWRPIKVVNNSCPLATSREVETIERNNMR